MKWILLAALAANSASAFAGNELGNGGDSYAQEFVALGREMVEEVTAHGDPRVTHPEALSKAVDETTVHSTGPLELGGSEVDALNFPTLHRIEFDRGRWKEYSYEQKSSLALHEYLGIAGEHDDRYQISSAYRAEGESAPPQPIHVKPTFGSSRSVATSEGTGEEEINSHRFSLELGTGYTGYTGNLGKLYGSDGIPVEAFFAYQLGSNFRVRLGLSKAKYSFVANLGSVEVDMLTAILGAEYHPSSQSHGLDPYVTVNLTDTSRSQNFEDLNQVEKEISMGYRLGLGLAYPLAKNFGVWAEASLGNQFFGDRFLNVYETDGIRDMTGLQYMASTGIAARF